MKKVDTTIAIVSRKSKIFEKYTELPSGDKFTEEITVKVFHPPRVASKITCYVQLQSNAKFNEIKYATAVMEFLKKESGLYQSGQLHQQPSFDPRIPCLSSKPRIVISPIHDCLKSIKHDE
eukprot:scaffold4929_cov47-Attheya_sp.AAC.2